MAIKKVVASKMDNCEYYCKKNHYQGSQSNAVYGIGIFGAAFYFFPQAVGLGGFAMAIFKSLTWPAFIVYQALSFFKL